MLAVISNLFIILFYENVADFSLRDGHPIQYGIDATQWDLFIEREMSNQDAVLNNIKVMGVEWVRVGVWYDRVMRVSSWEGLDRYVSDCKTRNLKILVNLLSYMDVHNLTQWLYFVETIVSRYKGEINAYEILNEQDDPTPDSIWPTPMKFNENPDLYAEFLTASYDAIKRIDPDAIIVMGGTTTIDDGSYVEKVLKAGGRCDAVATHFYGTILDVDRKMIPKILRLQSLNKAVWITEAGQDSSLGTRYQAEWIKETFNTFRRLKVDVAFFFTYPYLMKPQSLYGSPTEAYDTFKHIVKEKVG